MTIEEVNRLREVAGAIHSHESFGTVDGPGVRYVFFLQGCPLRCLYCHNPDSIPFAGGEQWTAGQVVDEVLKYEKFIQNGGATLSGGEPLAQPEFTYAILKLLKEAGVHTALDTAGSIGMSKPFVSEAISLADLILLDIKSVDDDVSQEVSGMDSSNAFATLDYCQQIGKPVWIRQVLLRGYTLDPQQLERLAVKLKPYSVIERVELLPFHKLGEPKWESLNAKYTLGDVEATTQEEAAEAREIFLRHGFKVQ